MGSNTGIFGQLKKEHREATQLIEQLEKSIKDGDVEIRRELFPKLKTELTAHAHAEQKQFYTRVKDLTDAIEEEIEDDLAEHEEMEGLLDELAAMSYDDPEWKDVLMELKKAVEHHVDDEENELFPAVDECLANDELVELQDRYLEQKEEELLALGEDEYQEMTKAELYQRAREEGVEGRSQMNKDELASELREH